jgi:hypothetical protein
LVVVHAGLCGCAGVRFSASFSIRARSFFAFCFLRLVWTIVE